MTPIPENYLIAYLLMIALLQFAVSFLIIFLIVEWKKKRRVKGDGSGL